MLRSHYFSAILTASPALARHSGDDFIALLRNAIIEAELIPLGALSVALAPQGISAVVLLQESHVALHYWPELGQVTIDIHICDYRQDNYAKARQLAARLSAALGDGAPADWQYWLIAHP